MATPFVSAFIERLRSEFLLHIYELIQSHNDLHSQLTGEGKWSTNNKVASLSDFSHEDLMKIDRYVGLFEGIKIIVEDEIIDSDIIDKLFSHRIAAIMSNKILAERYSGEKWKIFRDLIYILDKCELYKSLIHD